MTTTSRVDIFIFEHREQWPINELLRLYPWTMAEKEQISRFISMPAATSWCLSRILTRQILTHKIGIPVEQIVFNHNSFGKPYLQNNPVFINWSHTTGCLVLGVCRYTQIGIDIEKVEESAVKADDIASSFFTEEEYEWIKNSHEKDKNMCFLSLFVQKEAYLKMKGTGLSTPLAEAPAQLLLPPFQENQSVLFTTGEYNQFIISACIETTRQTDGNVTAVKPFQYFSCSFNPELNSFSWQPLCQKI